MSLQAERARGHMHIRGTSPSDKDDHLSSVYTVTLWWSYPYTPYPPNTHIHLPRLSGLDLEVKNLLKDTQREKN